MGDVDEDDEDFPDATYQAFLDIYAQDEKAAALPLVNGLIALYTRNPQVVQAGTVKEDYGNRLAFLENVKKAILAGSVGAPVASFTDPCSEECGAERRLFDLRMQF